MRNFLICLFCALFSITAFAQQETMDENSFCYHGDIMHYIESHSLHEEIYWNQNHPDKEKAISAAWDAFYEAFSIETLPHSSISTIFESAALSRIDNIMGNAGYTMALIQIVSDLNNGDKLSAMSNSVKTSMFYTINTWGWKSLKVAGAGLQVFDYMLTSFGQTAITAKQKALADAYNEYYLSGMGKRNLTTWKAIIEGLENSQTIEEEIDKYLDEYFIADDSNKRITYRHYTKEEVLAVKQDYLNTYLLPYLQPLFLSLEKEAREKKLEELCKNYKTIISLLNTPNRYRIRLDAKADQYEKYRAAIEVRKKDGRKSIFVLGNFDEKGTCYLSFTKYSLLLNNIESATALLLPRGQEKALLSQDIDLHKERVTIDFSLPEKQSEEKKEEPKEKKHAKAEESIKKPEGLESNVELRDNMQALFIANAVPLDLTIKKIREDNKEFVGKLLHKKMPKKNTLTINKNTREIKLVYQLSGPFAPELICQAMPAAANSYNGIIFTNDANRVEVGTFTLILRGN